MTIFTTAARDMTDVQKRETIERAIQAVVSLFEDPADPNVTETPERVAKAMVNEWFAGYSINPADVIKTFPNREQEGELVMVTDIDFYSMCAHHMAPFFGKASIAYIPDDTVLGLSKFARVIDIYARRMQLQERITRQTADALEEHLKPKGVMVVLHGVTHMCACSRGVNKPAMKTTTSAVRGLFMTNAALRAETLALLLKD